MKNRKRDFKFRSLQVFILQKFKRKRTKIQKLNEIQKYLNVEKRKKDIGRNLKNYKEKIKKYIGRRGHRQPWPINIVIFLKRENERIFDIIILYRYLAEIS